MATPLSGNLSTRMNNVLAPMPKFLQGYEELYAQDPRSASLQWFKDAKFGLFIHYGLYSLHGIHPFEQWYNKTHVAEYEKLKNLFTAEKFDAEYIADLAVELGMKYINLVTKHCEGFSLWDTKQSNFNSVNSPAGRDLVAEMAKACEKRNLGLFLFYEHGFDWRHPHGPRFKDWNVRLAEVDYEKPEPTYATEEQYNFQNYVDFVYAQIEELLTNYGAVAGVWLDGVRVPKSGDHTLFQLPELYDMIHRLQPHALVSYKYGVTNTEDFLAPEYVQLQYIKDRNHKPMEICSTLCEAWGHAEGAPRKDEWFVLSQMAGAHLHNANLLMNVGPLGDGSLHPDEEKALRKAAEILKKQFV